MSKSLAQMKASLSVEARAKVDARTIQLLEEIDGLKPLRTAMDKTQAALAERLHISQASVAKLEQRTDLLLSTLRQYVKALGGDLNIVASFPGHPEVRIAGLGDISVFREPAAHGKRSSAQSARRRETIAA
jgi:transcriptional regulator with XRE-family HTH domain